MFDFERSKCRLKRRDEIKCWLMYVYDQFECKNWTNSKYYLFDTSKYMNRNQYCNCNSSIENNE